MEKILVAIDFSDLATQVIDHAAMQAKAFGCEVLIVHVEPPSPAFIGNELSPPVVPEQHTEEIAQIHEDLKAMTHFLRQRGVNARYEYLQGSIIDTIIQKAKEFNSDMIMMGAHNHGFLYRAFIGSISTGVLKTSPCPVLVVPER